MEMPIVLSSEAKHQRENNEGNRSLLFRSEDEDPKPGAKIHRAYSIGSARPASRKPLRRS